MCSRLYRKTATSSTEADALLSYAPQQPSWNGEVKALFPMLALLPAAGSAGEGGSGQAAASAARRGNAGAAAALYPLAIAAVPAEPVMHPSSLPLVLLRVSEGLYRRTEEDVLGRQLGLQVITNPLHSAEPVKAALQRRALAYKVSLKASLSLSKKGGRQGAASPAEQGKGAAGEEARASPAAAMLKREISTGSSMLVERPRRSVSAALSLPGARGKTRLSSSAGGSAAAAKQVTQLSDGAVAILVSPSEKEKEASSVEGPMQRGGSSAAAAAAAAALSPSTSIPVCWSGGDAVPTETDYSSAASAASRKGQRIYIRRHGKRAAGGAQSLVLHGGNAAPAAARTVPVETSLISPRAQS